MLYFILFYFIQFSFCDIQPIIHKRILKNGDGGAEYYRIPAITFAPDNKTLVTATDKRWVTRSDLPNKIDVVIKISKDNGLTWTVSKEITPGKSDKFGYGDPCLIVDRQANLIFCLYTGIKGTMASTKDDRQRNYYCVSKDNGETWSSPIDITDMLYGTGCRDPIRSQYYSCFLTSGNGLQTRSGRLMLVGIVRETSAKTLSTHTVYSDDHGKTWTMSPYASVNDGDESKLVELNNGSIIMDIRTKKFRRFSISNDEGITWNFTFSHPYLQDPGCNGEIMRYTSTLDGYDKNRLLHTNVNHSSVRQNLVIKVSYDEGNTWVHEKVICAGRSIYSSIAVSVIDGKIYVYWEKNLSNNDADGFDLVVTTLTLDWITDGKDTWKPPSR
ncbi:hypothetical protein M9Y10_042277 [Tritrichomonas musculus]|uniref:Sialidase domain-containing protein n=1 Tax=Tritrichomonas musculus TaxID=1915356 RepID=A0ABR2GP00_9EUKA